MISRTSFLFFASVVALVGCSSGSSSDDGDAGDDAGSSNDSISNGDTHATNDSSSSSDSHSNGDSNGDSKAGSDTSADGADGSTGAMTNPAPGAKLFVGANFWNIDWEGADDFFVSGVDFTTTTNPWRPELLADLAPYHVLRFMDWNQTNDSDNPQAHWATRKQKTQPQNEPVAFEWQIDLCNRTKKDYWLNIPHEATPDDWQKIATLVHDSLDPSLRVYLEFSNEVWNSGFPQHAYAAKQADSLSLPGTDRAAAYYVYASVRLYETFESVFGKGSPRLVRVLAGQAAWTGPCDEHAKDLKDTTINPKGTMPDVYAAAPYFSGTSISELTSALATITDWTKSDVTCAVKIGVPLVSYEGGQDSFSAGSGCATLQVDPAMHDLYGTYFDDLVGAGMKGPFMQYTHTGQCWGLKQKTGDDPSKAPKYKGVVDWIAAHP